MPRMTGPELAEKALAESPTTKLLCMSGYTDDLIGARELESGDKRLLRKPFSPEELLAGVRGAIDDGPSA